MSCLFLTCLDLLKTENTKYVMMFSRALIGFDKFLLEKLVVANLMKNSTVSVKEPENLILLRKRSEPD
jgi:hypothetical protein